METREFPSVQTQPNIKNSLIYLLNRPLPSFRNCENVANTSPIEGEILSVIFTTLILEQEREV